MKWVRKLTQMVNKLKIETFISLRKRDGNRPQEPKVLEVEFFRMEEVLNEEIEIHGQPDH